MNLFPVWMWIRSGPEMEGTKTALSFAALSRKQTTTITNLHAEERDAGEQVDGGLEVLELLFVRGLRGESTLLEDSSLISNFSRL